MGLPEHIHKDVTYYNSQKNSLHSISHILCILDPVMK